MQRKTVISSNPTHNTKFIDPRTGNVLREGKLPTQTVGEFKANPTQAPEQDNRVDKIEEKVDKLTDTLAKLVEKLDN